ncbi:unannotated protein [freshwater metagenome]|jgi:uncharacterized protein (TIGR02611 family)|uniref:Unannotated protein n=1 Tax=freshwater metagenome TaxID=449393 RepID=A0A6J6INN1_9ZZZZ|nr:hypothetical protein [Actinomycetota bacterium]MSZ23924.1 hypothetical protein [Actinomycetota bacterium]MSZ93543.1 hypothetical protein [Actinomycetota bacterium]
MTKSSHHGPRERLEKLEQAAIEAEFETGRQEETVAEAKRHILVRIGRVTLGIVVLFAGLLMLPLPGPGLVTIAAGLALLASDVPYARKLLENVRKRLPADSEGNVSRPVVIGGLVVSVITISCSMWWTFFR